jgi:hypothetical protein
VRAWIRAPLCALESDDAAHRIHGSAQHINSISRGSKHYYFLHRRVRVAAPPKDLRIVKHY